jgi:hypothetical protein
MIASVNIYRPEKEGPLARRNDEGDFRLRQEQRVQPRWTWTLRLAQELLVLSGLAPASGLWLEMMLSLKV